MTIILAGLVILTLFAYSQVRYYEGKIQGFNDAEKICRKYHGAWKL